MRSMKFFSPHAAIYANVTSGKSIACTGCARKLTSKRRKTRQPKHSYFLVHLVDLTLLAKDDLINSRGQVNTSNYQRGCEMKLHVIYGVWQVCS